MVKIIESIYLGKNKTVIKQYNNGKLEYILNKGWNTQKISKIEYNILKNCEYIGLIDNNLLFKHDRNDIYIILPEKTTKKPILSDEIIYRDMISIIFEDDLNDHFVQCGCCEDWFNLYDMVYVESENRYVCESCLENNYCTCEDCGAIIPINDAISDDTGFCLCQNCYDNDYIRCFECERIINNNDAYYSERDNVYYCENCYNDSDMSDYIQSYGYQPKLSFFDNGEISNSEIQNKRYFGLEIELENNNGYHDEDALSDLYDITGIYMTEDGSLDASGVEITTHPMTLDYLKDNLKSVCNIAHQGGYRGGESGNCGLHIHVNRNSIPDIEETLPKLVLILDLIYDDIIKKIDRRKNRGYCNKNGFLDMWMLEKTDKSNFDKKKKEINELFSRNSVLNLKPENTIEFRFFGSTTKTDSIISSVQFINILIDIASELDFEAITSVSLFDLIGYCISISDYSELKEYYSSRLGFDASKIKPVFDEIKYIKNNEMDLSFKADLALYEILDLNDDIDWNILFELVNISHFNDAYTVKIPAEYINSFCNFCDKNNKNIVLKTDLITNNYRVHIYPLSQSIFIYTNALHRDESNAYIRNGIIIPSEYLALYEYFIGLNDNYRQNIAYDDDYVNLIRFIKYLTKKLNLKWCDEMPYFSHINNAIAFMLHRYNRNNFTWMINRL